MDNGADSIGECVCEAGGEEGLNQVNDWRVDW